ncbi:MAG: hypothetical protein ABEL51_13180 [Salinibacter sp.]
MALSSPLPDSSPLKHLDTLYPLACMLAGPDAAPSLLQRLFEDAAESPPSERPQDGSGWVKALFRAHDPASPLASRESSDGPSPASDSMRREAAQEIVRETLPMALSACSPQERFLIALDALETAEGGSEPIPPALQPADARASLREQLRALLSDRERALVEDALPDGTLRKATEELLSERYTSISPQLRARLKSILETMSPPTEPEAESSLLDRLPRRLTPRSLLFALLFSVLVLGGGITVSYLFPASPASSASAQSLTAFSVQQSEAVTSEFETRSPARAKAYVDSVWNRAVTVPSIDGAPLRGVGRLRTDEGVDIPAFLYKNENAPITTFAYNYALVDQLKNEASLSTNVRAALAESNAFVSGAATSNSALLWRHRDDIYVTIAPTLPPDSLRHRLHRPR